MNIDLGGNTLVNGYFAGLLSGTIQQRSGSGPYAGVLAAGEGYFDLTNDAYYIGNGTTIGGLLVSGPSFFRGVTSGSAGTGSGAVGAAGSISGANTLLYQSGTGGNATNAGTTAGAGGAITFPISVQGGTGGSNTNSAGAGGIAGNGWSQSASIISLGATGGAGGIITEGATGTAGNGSNISNLIKLTPGSGGSLSGTTSGSGGNGGTLSSFITISLGNGGSGINSSSNNGQNGGTLTNCLSVSTGNGGQAEAGGVGGTAGNISDPILLFSSGSGGSALAGPGANGGAIFGGIYIAGGNGGEGGIASGVAGGAGGAVPGHVFIATGGTGGNGGSNPGATGGAGGQPGSINISGGAGGSGEPSPGGSGGNGGFINLAGANGSTTSGGSGGSITLSGGVNKIVPSVMNGTTSSSLIIPFTNANDTIATLDAIQTLTNKTLTSPVIGAIVPAAAATAITVPNNNSGTDVVATIDTIIANMVSVPPFITVWANGGQTSAGGTVTQTRDTIVFATAATASSYAQAEPAYNAWSNFGSGRQLDFSYNWTAFVSISSYAATSAHTYGIFDFGQNIGSFSLTPATGCIGFRYVAGAFTPYCYNRTTSTLTVGSPILYTLWQGDFTTNYIMKFHYVVGIGLTLSISWGHGQPWLTIGTTADPGNTFGNGGFTVGAWNDGTAEAQTPLFHVTNSTKIITGY